MHVTVLGMGSMGRAFAGRALERGHQVTVWNRSPGRASELVDRGAVEAASVAAAVAGAAVVLVVVADDDAVVDVCLGESGALASLGTEAVLANVSTVAPETVRRLADAVVSGAFLDSPVMGSPEAVAGGLGRFYVGGPLPTITALESLWNDLGSGYTHCGSIGSATTMKLVSNLLLVTGVAALAEAIATARGSGIPDDLLRSVFADSPVVSFASTLRLNSVLDDTHPGWFSPELARKDVRHAIAVAEEAGVGVRLGPATERLLTEAIDAGREWPDFTAVIEALG